MIAIEHMHAYIPENILLKVRIDFLILVFWNIPLSTQLCLRVVLERLELDQLLVEIETISESS